MCSSLCNLLSYFSYFYSVIINWPPLHFDNCKWNHSNRCYWSVDQRKWDVARHSRAKHEHSTHILIVYRLFIFTLLEYMPWYTGTFISHGCLAIIVLDSISTLTCFYTLTAYVIVMSLFSSLAQYLALSIFSIVLKKYYNVVCLDTASLSAQLKIIFIYKIYFNTIPWPQLIHCKYTK